MRKRKALKKLHRILCAFAAITIVMTPVTAYCASMNLNTQNVVSAKDGDVNPMAKYVGLNLDPALGDFLGGEINREAILAAGKQALEQMEADEAESEYARLAIAQVSSYVNIRSIPSTDGKVLGKIYNGAVADVIETAGEDDDWFHVTSGSVEGYIKAEYFIYGEEAAERIEEFVTRYVVINASKLNIRKDATTSSKKIGYLTKGEKAKILENLGDWIKIEYSEGHAGYVSSEFVDVTEEFTYAISIEEEKAEIARQKALEERRRQEEAEAARLKAEQEAAALAEQAAQAQANQDQTAQNQADQTVAPQDQANQGAQVITPAGEYSTTQELRDSLVEYALQFVGNPYINGGNSLTNGTDCSGFTKLIFAEYGYSLGRTPASQLSSAGRSIDYSEIQKGDIICYSSNGGKSCTHVAIYIGDDMIVHAANSKKGICTQKALYSTIMGVKNVID